MADQIVIVWKHLLSEEQVAQGIARVGAKMGEKYGAKVRKDGSMTRFVCSGPAQGISGAIETAPGFMRVLVILPFLFRSFDKRIRQGIEDVLRAEVGGYPYS